MEVKLCVSFFNQINEQCCFSGLFSLFEKKLINFLFLFFRNHFFVVVNHAQQLYALVTDKGFNDSPQIVWEVNNIFLFYFKKRKFKIQFDFFRICRQ